MSKKEKKAPKKEVVEKTTPQEPVNTTEAQPAPKQKQKGKVLGKFLLVFIGILILLILLLISIGITYLVTAKFEKDQCDDSISLIDSDYQECLVSMNEFETEKEECEDTLDGIEEPVCDCTDIEGPVQTIRIGESGSLRIPSGWLLAGVNTSFRYLTEAEEVDMIKPENNGLWPIYESTEYSVAVSEDTDSVLAITDHGLFVPGATGFMPDELTGDYKVLSTEKNDNDEIAVRYKDGSDYVYLLVYDNPDFGSADPVMYSADVKYIYFDLNYPTVVYSGATGYLEDADQIFIEACLRDSTKLCNGSDF